MKTKIILLSLLVSIAFISCDRNPDTLPLGDILYLNSFETDDDLAEFTKGAASVEQHADAPAQGDEKSLLVSGGCVLPHLSGEIGPFERDHTIEISLWGRLFDETMLGGSGVTFYYGDQAEDHRPITLENAEWQKYTAEPLFVPAGEIIYLNFMCGGIAASTGLFDLIQLESI